MAKSILEFNKFSVHSRYQVFLLLSRQLLTNCIPQNPINLQTLAAPFRRTPQK
jgi:hypothetical protein